MKRMKIIFLIYCVIFIGLARATTVRSMIALNNAEVVARSITEQILSSPVGDTVELSFWFCDVIVEQRIPLLNRIFQLLARDVNITEKVSSMMLTSGSMASRQNQLDLSYFKNLRMLNLSGAQLLRLPNLANLINLESLFLGNNQLGRQVELDFSALTSLRWLDLSSNGLKRLPQLTGLINLQELSLDQNQLGEQETLLDFPNLPSLEKINLKNNNLALMPNVMKLQQLRKLTLDNNPRLAEQHLQVFAGTIVKGINLAHIDYFVPEPTTVGDERLLANLDEFTLTASLLLTAHTWLTDNDIAPIIARVQNRFAHNIRVSVAELKRWIEEDELVQRHSQPAQVVAIENAAQSLELFDVATSDDDRPVFLSRSTLMALQADFRYRNPLTRQSILPMDKARSLAAAWLYWYAIKEEDCSYKYPIGVQYFDALARQEDPVAQEPFTVATIIALDYLKARGLSDAQSSVILRELPKYERNFVLVTDLLDTITQRR